MGNDNHQQEVIHTKIWDEEPCADNPFAADKCYCSGYDVYGELLANATWFEYLYLLFKLEKPEKWEIQILEKIAIAIANPGIRDHSVRAAMNAGVGGSTSASALMSALAVGAGQFGGAREVYSSVVNWEKCRHDLAKWELALNDHEKEEVDGWPNKEHAPGFDPNSRECSRPVMQTLSQCAEIEAARNTKWLLVNREKLESITGMPLAMTGVASAVFYDLQLNAEQSEMAFLMLRLPGAAVHALEQKQMGWKKYPFFSKNLKII